MKRPWQVWLAFLLCLMVVLPGMVWLSIQALQLDRQLTLASRQADLEEDISLALWRMDVALAPLVAQEAARPFIVYRPFLNESIATTKGVEQLEPSPLLTQPSDFVRLHFQRGADGKLTSPQNPTGPQVNWAIEQGAVEQEIQSNCTLLCDLEEKLQAHDLLVQLPQRTLPPVEVSQNAWDNRDRLANLYEGNSVEGREQVMIENDFRYGVANEAANERLNDSSQVDQMEQTNDSQPFLPPNISRDEIAQVDLDNLQEQQMAGNDEEIQARQQERWLGQYGGNFNTYGRVSRSQSQRGDLEYKRRNRALQTYTSTEVVKQRAALPKELDVPSETIVEGVSAPIWVEGELLLARRVAIDDQMVVQGVWFDWPKLKSFLIGEGAGSETDAAAATLPAFDLRPLALESSVSPARRLATLPVEIVLPPLTSAATEGITPIELSLIIAWICLLLATFAVAILLRGVVTLSERRGAFVSAVTHELRTPLTTFRMYAEMLSEGMVNDQAQRQSYAETLRVEADRLYHLVENVLSYARLERGRKRGRREKLTLAALLERIVPRLEDRATQAGMQFIDSIDEKARQVELHTDPQAVEQILFNLVDNACKYAVAAEDKRVELSAQTVGGNLHLHVRDHGPGISAKFSRQLFRPFSKSCEDAAVTAPGVGLGLALCQRLARDLGGCLTQQLIEGQGACFELRLRLADGSPT